MTGSPQDVTIWERLAAPIPPGAVQWRADGRPVMRDGQSMVRQVAYIDAQLVRSRLDAVVPGEWDSTLELLPTVDDDGERVYAFKVRLQVLGVIREDVGMGRDYFSQCPHRMACARCRHYEPKPASAPQLVELQRSHAIFTHGIHAATRGGRGHVG